MRFYRDEYGIDCGKLSRVIETQNPAPVGLAVHVENTEIHGVRFLGEFRIFLAPYLEDTGRLHSSLTVEIEGIENQGLALCIKDPPKGLSGPAAAVHIEHVSNVKLACAHQFADVAIGGEKPLIVSESSFLISIGCREIANSRFERRGVQKRPVMFCPQAHELGLQVLVRLLSLL